VTKNIAKLKKPFVNKIIGHSEERLDQLLANPRNFRFHPDNQQQALAGSIDEVGFIRSLSVNKNSGAIIDGHARVAILMRSNVEKVMVEWLDLTDEEEAKAILMMDAIAEMAAKDKEKLDALMREVQSDDERVQQMIADMGAKEGLYDIQTQEQREAVRDSSEDSRSGNIDLMWTQGYPSSTSSTQGCCIATRSGWLYGIQSTGSCFPCTMNEYTKTHKVVFVDNEFKLYDHAEHVRVVSLYHPKYCTVRDIMSEEQCKESGIAYYPLELILEWAEELSECADKVIVIPKIDVLDKIPEKFMLGYSVPTSYGGTPLPIESFRGRNVHLLGGSPNKQIAFWQRIPDDVISLDNNYILKMAKFGQVWMPDGRARALSELGLGLLTNPMYSALSLSLGNFAAYFHKRGNDEAQVQDAQNGEIE
jgi:hypothetical protein